MHIDSFDDESKRGVRIDQYLLEKGGGYDKIKWSLGILSDHASKTLALNFEK